MKNIDRFFCVLEEIIENAQEKLDKNNIKLLEKKSEFINDINEHFATWYKR